MATQLTPMFTYVKGTDYYEMFEACMSDPDYEKIADDSEDYDEFIKHLENGTYVPK